MQIRRFNTAASDAGVVAQVDAPTGTRTRKVTEILNMLRLDSIHVLPARPREVPAEHRHMRAIGPPGVPRAERMILAPAASEARAAAGELPGRFVVVTEG
jgi:hypothetical protein